MIEKRHERRLGGGSAVSREPELTCRGCQVGELAEKNKFHSVYVAFLKNPVIF